MDDDDFDAWKLCWKANLHFYDPVSQCQYCIICNVFQPLITNETGIVANRRSVFWLDGTCCSAGHRQATQNELNGAATPNICATCDQNYMFEVMKGQKECRMEGCRRVVRIDQGAIQRRLTDQKLKEQFVLMLLNSKTYECAIHGDDVEYDPSDCVVDIENLANSFVGLEPPTAGCDHDRKVCNDCLKITFERAIQGGRLQDLVCPDPECKKAISMSTIRSHVSAEVFKIYNKKLALKAISRNEHFRWCTCGHGQIHEPGENNPEWNCLSCKKRRCFICPEEPSDSCKHLQAIDTLKTNAKARQREAAQRLFQIKLNEAQVAAQKAKEAKERAEREAKEKEAAANRKEIARTTKKCPQKGCGNKIERNEGCGHFTCRKCQTEFCWCCKVIWRAGRALHLVGCEIGTKRTTAKANLDTTDYAIGWDKDPGYDKSLDAGLWLIGAQQ